MRHDGSIALCEAAWPRDADTVRTLFSAYAAGLGIDLAYQGFDAELAGLPGRYAPPAGTVLVAWRKHAVGCVALRPLADGDAELKRLFVRADARGARLGERLLAGACQAARAAGYTRLCLDTLPTMTTAARLYRAAGFVPIAPYAPSPVAGTLYFALDLAAAAR